MGCVGGGGYVDVMDDDDVDVNADTDADDDVMMMTILSVLIFLLCSSARFTSSLLFISKWRRGENSFQNGIAFDLYFGIAFYDYDG